MRVLLQRVARAEVRVDDQVIGAVGRGLLLLVGFGRDDRCSVLQPMAEKISKLRVFPDRQGRLQYSVRDIGGGVLAVPQFTLYAETRRGRRPEFLGAMEPQSARVMFKEFTACMARSGIEHLASGQFGAHMLVSLDNDGPVTLMLER